MKEFSLVPKNFRDKDPRSLAKTHPNTIRTDNRSFISFVKKWQKFDYYNSLNMFEEYAHSNGFILFPATIMHWRRCEHFGEKRRARVGRKSFYLVREYELTEREKKRLNDYITEVREGRL